MSDSSPHLEALDIELLKVCLMGTQVMLLSLNTVSTAIGRYVNIKIGKVNVYKIFFAVLQWICFHSVMVVISPKNSSVRYMLRSAAQKLKRAVDESTSFPLMRPYIIATKFTINIARVSVKAGAIVASIS